MSDNPLMVPMVHLHQNLIALAKAAAGAAQGRLRTWGLLSASDLMTRRLSVCQNCCLCVPHKGRLYCGRPFLNHPFRDETIEGCGCPVAAKAATPHEHCPLQVEPPAASCSCKWCASAQARIAAEPQPNRKSHRERGGHRDAA